MLVYLLSNSGVFKGKTKDFKITMLAFILYGVAFGAMWKFEKTKNYAKYLIPLFIADLVVYKLVVSKVEEDNKAKKLKKKKSVKSSKSLSSKVKPKLVKSQLKTSKKSKNNLSVKSNKSNINLDTKGECKREGCNIEPKVKVQTKSQEELEKEKRLEESKKELEKQKKAIEELERIRKLEAEYINNSSLIETTQENQVDTKPIQELNQESNKQEDLESINIPIYRPNISSKN